MNIDLILTAPRSLLLCTCLLIAGWSSPSKSLSDDNKQQELDGIFSLLAMAVVHKDWQASKERGHNIGSVLVDPAGKPVFWARNSRYITNIGTQHGEVRLIRKASRKY